MLNFKFIVQEDSNLKGKPLKCKHCGFKFRILEDEERNKWVNQSMICPKCFIDLCVLPKTERELKHLQEKFLQDKKNEKIIKEYYELFRKYIRSRILKLFTNVVNDPDEIDFHSHNATSKIFEQYIVRPDFKITDSFANYAIWKIKESIWHKSQHATAEYNIHEQSDDGKLKFDYGVECKVSEETNLNNDYADYKNEMISFLIQDIYSHKDSEIEFKLLLSLLNFINGKDPDRLFQKYGVAGKTRFQAMLNRFKRKLMKK